MKKSSSLFLEALNGRNGAGRPPVWLMRQAGRYMPEYRAIRKSSSFLEMCHTPEIAEEVTHLPVNLLGVDAAILFSDILVIPEALKVGLRFDEGVGPIIENPLKTERDVISLPKIGEELSFVFETIKRLKSSLSVPLIGFAGAPFTLASYMIEGGSSKDLKKTKQWMMQNPKSFQRLLDHLTSETITYLEGQQNAGIDAFQLFDSWANVLSHTHFERFCLPSYKKILEKAKVPTILFCRGSSCLVPSLLKAHPKALSLDWQANLKEVRKSISQEIVLQGNLDPDVLYAPLKTIELEVRELLDSMRGDKGFIFNLGHGVKPDMSVEAVKMLVDTVKGYS